MTGEPDLEWRVNARCLELMQRLDELEADTRPHGAETRDRLGATLSDLARILASSDSVERALVHWLAASASQLEVSMKGKLS